MSVTAATDTVLEDGRAVCVIRAHQLQPGDTWVEHGHVDLCITEVSDHPLWAGFILAYYRIGNSGIPGERAKALMEFISILPRVDTPQNGAH